MWVVNVVRVGGSPQLTLGQEPRPIPGQRQLLIEVVAAGVNPADVLQRDGKLPVREGASPILGLEVSGRVAAVGPGLEEDRWAVGVEVCALVDGGGYAEFVLADERCCLPVPENLQLSDIAAIPEAAFTVWSNLFEAPACIRSGQFLLLQGGTGGVGTFAIQLARERGVRVATTAGSDERSAICLELGADCAVDYHGDWVSAIKSWAPTGIDAVLDCVGGPYFSHHLDLLARRGHLAQLSATGGGLVQLDLAKMFSKQLTLRAASLRSLYLAEKASIRNDIEREVWPLLVEGRLRPVIHARIPLKDVQDAHELLADGSRIGKVILIA